eukprot:438562-Amphidinium_carterae.2
MTHQTHLQSSRGASAIDVTKEGSPPSGSELNEVHPESQVSVDVTPSPITSSQLEQAGAEVIVLPGSGGLTTVPEEPTDERMTQGTMEPEPPPSTSSGATPVEIGSPAESVAGIGTPAEPESSRSTGRNRPWQDKGLRDCRYV